MLLSTYQLQRFRCDGFIVVPDVFSANEVALLRVETERLISVPSDGLVLEDDNISPRSLNGPHLLSGLMRELVRSPRLLPVAEQILGDDVYLHQYKINIKRAFVGEQWEWHSDFWFWQEEDGMPAPEALTAAIFLDDVNDFNGPTLFVPGSHHEKLENQHHSLAVENPEAGQDWRTTTAKSLKYQLDRGYLSAEIGSKGIVAAKGMAGSVLFFHCNTLHASTGNPSPWNRRTTFISYNRVSNALIEKTLPRPAFLANRDFTKLTKSADALAGEVSPNNFALQDQEAVLS